MGLSGLAALIVVAGAVALVVRGWDVRLVLLSAALVMAGFAGIDRDPAHWSDPLAAVVREFFGIFSNEKFVVPICTAMGFAYVLRHTGCERHLVLLLVKPLRHVRFLMVPGVIAVGFLVNIPVISQTSTAVCIGPVVVPLMRAAGYSLATIGACLLLGASVGGELLNPGAPELLTVSAANPDDPRAKPQVQATEFLPPLVFTQLAVSMLVCWAMSVWWERKASETASTGMNPAAHPETAAERINFLKAAVAVVPLVLLFACGPPFNLFHVPEHWVAKPEDVKQYNSRLIGLAMVVGVLVAMAVSWEKVRECPKMFFEGAGYGFANIISLIVTANCFGKAIETAGLATALGQLITAAPSLMQPLAAFVPLAFAAVSGSGMASTQSLYGFFHGPAIEHDHDPVAVGALVSLGAAAGRTMSPVAAVVLMCATLTTTNPFTLAKRVAVPLLVGMAVVTTLRMCGVL